MSAAQSSAWRPGAAAVLLLLAPAEARADAMGNPLAWLLVIAALPLGAGAALATWPLVPSSLKGSRLRERLRTWSGLAFIFALLFIALFMRCAGM
jgi:hypothetical protein